MAKEYKATTIAWNNAGEGTENSMQKFLNEHGKNGFRFLDAIPVARKITETEGSTTESVAVYLVIMEKEVQG